MIKKPLTKAILLVLFASILVSVLFYDAAAESVPEWVKKTALWYGEGSISETEFLNAIKFLINNKIIILDESDSSSKITSTIENVIIPNGNSLQSNSGFYIPINLQVKSGTTVMWKNEDNFGHTVQSQDEEGKIIPLFNSGIIRTGESFEHKFTEPGEYHYFCSVHPWRVGVITVS